MKGSISRMQTKSKNPVYWLKNPGYTVTACHKLNDRLNAYMFEVCPVDINGNAVCTADKLRITYAGSKSNDGYLWSCALVDPCNVTTIFILADNFDNVCYVKAEGKPTTAKSVCSMWQKRLLPVINYIRTQYTV